MAGDLNNDNTLRGFWPLNEPSGAPHFQNYAPATALGPRRISYDMMVHGADIGDDETYGSIWPGTDVIFNQESGVNVRGYRVQGFTHLFGDDLNPYAKCLLMSNGNRFVRDDCLVPTAAQSGFTAGIWIYPTSDGYEGWNVTLPPSQIGWEQGSAYTHALYGMFGYDADGAGWIIGVSGKLANAAQFTGDLEGGPPPLRAFLLGVNDGTALEVGLGTPIESGRYTHITMSYRYVDGVNNEMVLYKDGRVAASGVTPFELTEDGVFSYTSRALTIGGTNDNTTNTNEYSHSTGWGHLVSGAYYFKRVLDEGEILDMHLCGGLQPDISVIRDTKEVSLFDSKLLSFLPFNGLGYGDASKNFRSFMDDNDPGDETENFAVPGPFSCGMRLQNSTNNSNAVVASSGLCSDIVEAGSWSIGVWGSMKHSNTREDNIVFSWGSVSSSTAANSNPIAAISEATFGLVLTEADVPFGNNRARLEVRPLGDRDDDILQINASGYEPFTRVMRHYGIVYDDQTRGVAMYVDGIQQHSGVLLHSMTNQLTRLVGSGFPLIFGNGIQDAVLDNTNKGFHTDGGQDNVLGQIVIMGRPLEPAEMRFIAMSGINVDATNLSQYDTRLMGYWPCDDHQDGDIVIEDKARVWNDFPGHLTRGDCFAKWERAYDRNHDEPAGSVFRPDGTAAVDLYGGRTVPPELASFGNLGITSGVWGVMGGSAGNHAHTDSVPTRSSRTDWSMRYKPNIEERDLRPQNILGEYIIGFEITPSGDIPAITFGQSNNSNKFEFNSCVFNYGNLGQSTTHGEQRAFLTSINAPDGSGVSIVFQNRNGSFSAANTRMIGSGNLIYGVPNNVMLHGKYDDPYSRSNSGPANGQALYTLTLYVNGQRVQQIRDTTTSLFQWELQPPGTAGDQYLLQFGGEICNDGVATQMTGRDSGLGENYLREMFIMRGIFTPDEVAELATSGIRNTAFAGYIANKPKTQVTIADSDLRGYWRFNGFEGGPAHGVQGSGTSDLSLAGNHLFPFAEITAQQEVDTEAAHFARYLPGPLRNSDLGVQCSGVTYSSRQPSNTVNDRRSLFMASGVGLNDPVAGFSIGFLMAKREDVVNNRNDAIIAYGCCPTSTVSTTAPDENFGWVIAMSEAEAMRMVMSQGGNIYLDNTINSASSGQTVCGIHEGGRTDDDLTNFENFQKGDIDVPRLDYWSHYMWTYNPTDDTLRCFLNGELVDQQRLKVEPEFWSGPQQPRNPGARYLTFFAHTDEPWTWDTMNVADFDAVLTDVCYFSRALDEDEVRYIAFNGIDDAVGTPTSGIAGGYMRGTDTGSGIIGGYEQGLDTGSGIIGGYFPAGITTSGIIGGFMSGVVFGDGTIGGWVQGLDIMSGIVGGSIRGLDVGSGMIAGYIAGQDLGSGLFGGFMRGGETPSGVFGGIMFGVLEASGIIGGYMLGGLEGLVEFDAGYTVSVMSAEDFDTQVHILRTSQADFDARVVIFEDEIGPLVDIPVPDVTVSGLAPPFNQYFVGKASGQQGKTIVKTRWTFGDLTPAVEVAESGAGCYPVLHNYAASGFYIAKFEAIDSDGQHGSATRIVNAASGIDPVIISLSGVPRSGDAALTIDFTTTVDILPQGVSISAKLLAFDDGQTTVSFNPTHVYSEPGVYKPIFTIRDSRGFIWNDSLEAGSDILKNS